MSSKPKNTNDGAPAAPRATLGVKPAAPAPALRSAPARSGGKPYGASGGGRGPARDGGRDERRGGPGGFRDRDGAPGGRGERGERGSFERSDRPYTPRRDDGAGFARRDDRGGERGERGSFGRPDRPYAPRRDDSGGFARRDEQRGGERNERGSFARPDRPYTPRRDEGQGFGRRDERGGDRGAERGGERGGFGRPDRPYTPRRDDGAGFARRDERGGDRGGDRGDRGGERGGFGRPDRPYTPRRDEGQGFERRDERGGERGERGSFARPERSDRFDRGERPYTPRRDDGAGHGRRDDGAGFGRRDDRGDAPRGPRSDRPARPARPAYGQDRDSRPAARGQDEDRSFRPAQGEERRAYTGIRTYRAPEALGGKAAPIKIIRPPEPAAPREDARPGEQRINKRMAELGMCSRREADEWVDKGWVTVNGEVAVMGQMVVAGDRIAIDPAAQAQQEQQVTILLHKPMGYVSGQAEDGHEPAVVLLNPQSRWNKDTSKTHFNFSQLKGLAPCGRLDIDSVGLLVLTQDGRVARQIIGEDSVMEKEYLVRVSLGEREVDVQSVFPAEKLDLLRHGLSLDDEPLQPAQVDWQNPEQLRFVLTEGKKRQIRRMCELVGLKVIGLKRIRIGQIVLGNLPTGQWRYLGENESF